MKVLNVFGLGLLTALGVGLLLLGEAFGGSLRFEIGTDSFDGCRRGPNAREKTFLPFFSANDPMIARRLHTASQCGIARRKQNPAVRDGQDFAIGCTDGVRRWAGGEGGVLHGAV